MDNDKVLEQSGGKKPDLNIIRKELEEAQVDARSHWSRMAQCRRWWNCDWDGQTEDGRCHSYAGNECYPWENAADSRLRTVQTIINEHVTLAKYAFWQAKIQCRSTRPIVQGRERNVAQRALQWRVYTHMRGELLRELPLAFAWRFGYGLSIMSVQWEQQRRIDYQQISLQQLDEVAQATGAGSMIQSFVDAVNDESQEDALVTLLQQMSPILSKGQARKIITDLRNGKTAEIPIAYPYVNKPKWTALQPTVDVLFPADTSDLQAARWISQREWVNESELRDRIETEGYDKAFVEKAIEHKGEPSTFMDNASPVRPYSSLWNNKKNLIELHHFYYKAMDYETPCVYKTIFSESTLQKNGSEPLYAWHGIFPYQHGQYPFVALRREYTQRELLSSKGIAEEAYTDEQNIKTQQDGLTNRTDLIHNPPMIVPPMRVGAVKGTWAPRAILGARPGEISWPNLPPIDGTPVEIIQMVMQRLDRRYPIFPGPEINPQLGVMHSQEVVNDINGEIESVLEQTLQLMQQFEMDADIAAVSGPNSPFHVDRKAIQGRYEISVTFDPRQSDIEYVKEKLGLLASAMPFKQEGMLFNLAMEQIEPDLADQLSDDQSSPAANERERNDELNAITMAMQGIDPPFPQMGNHQLRLQVLQQTTLQNPNPAFQQRLQAAPDAQQILQNRAKMFMNNIQQFQNNPQIGRVLGTQTFNKQLPPATTTAQP